MALIEFEAARKREVKLGSRGLPQGAFPFIDSGIQAILRDIWIKQIELFEKTGQVMTDSDLVSGLSDYETLVSTRNREPFHGQPNPQVEGHEWQFGIVISAKRLMHPLHGKSQVIIFSSFMKPHEAGGAPDPIVYTRGGVQTKDVLEIVQKYADGISARIKVSHPSRQT